MSDTPIYDQLIAERLGRGPTEFEGHDCWEESEDARRAYERGVGEARATVDAFWDRDTLPQRLRDRSPTPLRTLVAERPSDERPHVP